jgi:endonuclease YncB( thermonuclease family)
MVRIHAHIVAALLSVCAFAAHASELLGRVIRVTDGDTIAILDANNRQHKIRLASIDAPERRQAFGHRSTENLSTIAYGQEVRVDWKKFDRYGRIVGTVYVRGRDIGLAQIEAGLAWHYKAYAKEQLFADRMKYSGAELNARRLRRGLWSDADPTPPWEFRHRKHDGAGRNS